MTIISKANLAAELRISKARVSQYVAEGLPVRSDGKLNRKEALNWISRNHVDFAGQDKGVGRANTLARAQRQQPTARRVPASHRGAKADPVLETMVWRVRDWREIRARCPGGVRLPIDVAAALFAGGDRSAVLTWLRAGLPYAEMGDWETGDGFILISSWVIDWGRWVTAWAEDSGDDVSARELRLDCLGAPGGWTPDLTAQFAEAVAADCRVE